jgi:hypothetical protein
MTTVIARGWMRSPSGLWHYGQLRESVKGLHTLCGIRAEPVDWWTEIFDPREEPPASNRVCLRCRLAREG